VPYPGTKLHKIAKDNDWIITDDWDKYETAYSVMDNKNLSAEKVQKYREIALRSFYVRPTILFNNLKKVRSINAFIDGFSEFLEWINVKKD
jgi:hypothetical protein